MLYPLDVVLYVRVMKVIAAVSIVKLNSKADSPSLARSMRRGVPAWSEL